MNNVVVLDNDYYEALCAYRTEHGAVWKLRLTNAWLNDWAEQRGLLRNLRNDPRFGDFQDIFDAFDRTESKRAQGAQMPPTSTSNGRPTPGQWWMRVSKDYERDRSNGSSIYIGVGDYPPGEEHKGDFITVFKHGDNPSWEEHEANARLVIEAGNISNETGLTPGQIAVERSILLRALQQIVADKGSADCNDDLEAYDAAVATAREALARVSVVGAKDEDSSSVEEIVFDNTQAVEEGWWLSSTEEGIMQIQRLDDPGSFEQIHADGAPPFFASDEDARDFVAEQAQMGSDYHRRAMQLDDIPQDVRAARHDLEASRASYVLGAPDGTEYPNPDGWDADYPLQCKLLQRLRELGAAESVRLVQPAADDSTATRRHGAMRM